MRNVFSARLKERQKQLNLTQAKMAELINVAPGTLSAYLKQDKVPTLEKAVEIANALNVSVGWLCGEDDPKNRKLFHDGHVSYGYVISALNELNDIPWSDTFEIRSENVFCYSLGKTVSGVNIIISDPVIGKFYNDHQRVRELYKTNVIDREIYDAWIEKRMKEEELEAPLDILPF